MPASVRPEILPGGHRALTCIVFPRRLQGFKAALERALFPLVTIKQHIEDSSPEGQMHSDVLQFFQRTAPTLLNISPAANDLQVCGAACGETVPGPCGAPLPLMRPPLFPTPQIAPYGVISSIYPIVTARRNATQILLLGARGPRRAPRLSPPYDARSLRASNAPHAFWSARAGGHNLFDAKSPVANRRDGIVTTMIRSVKARRRPSLRARLFCFSSAACRDLGLLRALSRAAPPSTSP